MSEQLEFNFNGPVLSPWEVEKEWSVYGRTYYVRLRKIGDRQRYNLVVRIHPYTHNYIASNHKYWTIRFFTDKTQLPSPVGAACSLTIEHIKGLNQAKEIADKQLREWGFTLE